jgi:outer membrane receptor protein involved in Fe transport
LETYGLLSGPLTDDVSYRFNGSKRTRNGFQSGRFDTEDVGTLNDQNFSLALEWRPTDNVEVYTRFNDRRSLRRIQAGTILNEGWGSRRGSRSTDLYVYGLRDVTVLLDTDGDFLGDVAAPDIIPPIPGAELFTHPLTGAQAWAGVMRPGVDPAAGILPNPEYLGRGYLNSGARVQDGNIESEAYTNNLNREEFDQQAVSIEVDWTLDRLSLKYIFGYTDALYANYRDDDFSNSTFSDSSTRSVEEWYTYSHELSVIWTPTDKLDITAGVYDFYTNRLQDFSILNPFSQGRLGQPQDMGLLDDPNILLGGASILDVAGIGEPVALGQAPMGSTIAGRWDGSFDELGSAYRHKNKNETEQYAAYLQGVWQMSEQFALTLGVRWAEDKKRVLENRGGYTEFNFVAGFYPLVAAAPGLFGLTQAQINAIGAEFLTAIPGSGGANAAGLALTNVLLGSATATGIVGDPIVATCELTATQCATPLRLNGVPASYTGLGQNEDSWSDVSYRINLDWTPNDETLVYLSLTTGYRAGGFALGLGDARIDTVSGQVPFSYDEETVTAYEFGYKATLADGVLQFNTALYRYDYADYQDSVTLFDPLENRFKSLATNTGDAINQGVEVELTWLATANLTLNANYSYSDTAYQTDVFFIDNRDPTRPETLFGTDVLNIKNSSLKGIPEHKATAWGNYTWRTGIGSIALGVSVAYTGKYWPEGVELELYEVPARTRTDASLSWASNDEKIRARLWVDNVFDERMVSGVGTGNQGNNYRLTASLLGLRNYGLEVRWLFGGE